MMLSCFKYAICWLSVFHVANTQAPENNGLQISNGPGMKDGDTLRAVGRALHAAKIQGRDTTYTMNRTSIAKSWIDATLFEYDVSGSVDSGKSTLELDAGIEIICSTCYVNGSVTGQLKIIGDSNVTEIVDSAMSEVTNITTQAFDEFESYLEVVAKGLGKDIAEFDTDNIRAWPTLDLDFNLDNTTTFPGVEVSFEFDGLEFYVDLGVQLSAEATYTLNLYTSETIIGFSVPDLTTGVVFTVDLILIVDAEIDITGGIHVKLDDGLVLDLELFNQDVSSITVPSGSYEFLPVTIDGEGSLQAILRLESSLGFQISEHSFASFLDFSAGVGGSVVAYPADLLLQVNGSSAAGSGDCDLAAIAEYSVAVGAAAGATAAINTYQWGPTPNTTIPLFYTTLASVCAATMPSTTTPLVTATPELQGRDALTTTTVLSTVDYTLVNCVSSGLVECPVNLQNTTSVKKTLTSVMTVATGSDATFPASTFASVTSAIPFGTNARRLVSSSGTPTSYVPPTSSSTGGGGILDILPGNTDGKNDKLIIGLSVGLGVPFVACVVFGLYYWFRRSKKYAAVPQSSSALASGSPLQESSPVAPGPGDDTKGASVTVARS